MEQCKRRKELGLAEPYLYKKNTKSVKTTPSLTSSAK